MTIARQERKSLPQWATVPAIVTMAAVFTGGGLFPAPTATATTELIVANPYTGLAIDGFDPVAYFVDAVPMNGRPELEFRFAGSVWRFRNTGNRAAFMANPQVYMPRFGGYDPMALGRGAAAAGHPKVWLIAHDRLYLFYSVEARAAFAADPARAVEAAERHWPEVRRTLAP